MIIMKNNVTPRLPSEYQEVEYIESTGSQYIDTNVLSNIIGRFYLNAQFTEISDEINGSISSGVALDIGIISNKFFLRNGAPNDVTASADINRHEFEVDTINFKCYIDETVVSTASGSKPNFNLYLFARNNESLGVVTTAYFCKQKLYSCKIYNLNNTLIRDFVPCYRKVDNVVGLYDLVNDVFYINTGTGTFLMGVEVNKPYINLRPMVGSKKLTKRYVGENLIYGEVEPSYEQKVNYTMLYDNGDECTALTGGLKVSSRYNNAIATKYTDHIYLHTSTASAVTNNFIDLTQYVKFGGVLKNIVSTTGQARFAIGKSNTATDGTSLGWNGIAGNKVYNLTKSYSHFVGLYNLSKSESYYLATMVSDAKNNAYGSIYNMFLLKQDDWQTLCAKAGLNSSNYTDETTLCADSTAITTILSNETAVQYMIYNCTGSFMGELIANDACLTALSSSPYKTTIQANEHWNRFLNMVA